MIFARRVLGSLYDLLDSLLVRRTQPLRKIPAERGYSFTSTAERMMVPVSVWIPGDPVMLSHISSADVPVDARRAFPGLAPMHAIDVQKEL